MISPFSSRMSSRCRYFCWLWQESRIYYRARKLPPATWESLHTLFRCLDFPFNSEKALLSISLFVKSSSKLHVLNEKILKFIRRNSELMCLAQFSAYHNTHFQSMYVHVSTHPFTTFGPSCPPMSMSGTCIGRPFPPHARPQGGRRERGKIGPVRNNDPLPTKKGETTAYAPPAPSEEEEDTISKKSEIIPRKQEGK